MNRKYFAVADTYNIKECLGVKNIEYTFSAKSLNHAPKCRFNCEPDYDVDFFRHIRFYEIFFNSKGNPVRLHALGVIEDDVYFEIDWLEYSEHMSKIGFKNYFLKNNRGDNYFDSAEEMYRTLNKWGWDVTKEKVRERIIDAITEEEGEF